MTEETNMQPHFHSTDRIMFYRYLDNSKNYFEFGSGGSTYQASIRPNIEKLFSVESDPDWYNKLKTVVKNKNLDYKYIDLKTIPNKWGYPGPSATNQQKISYSDVICKINKEDSSKLDFILIDGRFRVACCLKCFDVIEENCLIAFDDFLNRNHYHIVLDYYEIVEKTKDNIMVILKKKKCNKPPVSLIKKYELIPG